MEPRSNFVTVLAWVFIVLSSLCILGSLMNLIMATVFLTGVEMPPPNANMSTTSRFLFENFYLIPAAIFAFMLFTLLSAIGLLKRKGWARVAFIAILAVAILAQLSGLALQFTMMPAFPDMPQPDGAPPFMLMMNMVMLVSVAFSLAVCILFGWIIVRLNSAAIRREFVPT